MTESIEKLSGKEKLHSLEAEGKYVFHGSENPNLVSLEPRQAYTIVDNIPVEDDKPAVHASKYSDIAILMALINIKNCPNGYQSGFSGVKDLSKEDPAKPRFTMYVTKEGYDQLTEDSKGYVYVFSKDQFTPREDTQAISYTEVQPVDIIEVRKEDWPDTVEIRPTTD